MKQLDWYTKVFPTLRNFPIDGNRQLSFLADYKKSTGFICFDCRSMPQDFLSDTGEESAAELLEGQSQAVRLPFPTCVFEFDDYCVVASDSCMYHAQDAEDAEFNDTHPFREVQLRCWPKSLTFAWLRAQGDRMVCYSDRATFDSFPGELLDDQPVPYTPLLPVNDADDSDIAIARSVIGVLALMEERLVTQTRPTVHRTQSRMHQRRQQQTRVLNLNLAEFQRVASRSNLQSHESPCLHWRRGHWRTLFRLSEIERRVWIKRCLVGDPSRGFATKIYRPVWQPTVH